VLCPHFAGGAVGAAASALDQTAEFIELGAGSLHLVENYGAEKTADDANFRKRAARFAKMEQQALVGRLLAAEACCSNLSFAGVLRFMLIRITYHFRFLSGGELIDFRCAASVPEDSGFKLEQVGLVVGRVLRGFTLGREAL
jgi:hypothetical protein